MESVLATSGGGLRRERAEAPEGRAGAGPEQCLEPRTDVLFVWSCSIHGVRQRFAGEVSEEPVRLELRLVELQVALVWECRISTEVVPQVGGEFLLHQPRLDDHEDARLIVAPCTHNIAAIR